MRKKKRKLKRDKTVAEYIRESKQYKSWRREQVARFGGKCWITETKSRYLHVHHAKENFRLILSKVLRKYKIPYHRPIRNLMPKTLNQVLRDFWSVHVKVVGIPLKRKLHNEFHRLYGKSGNTLDQLKEFKRLCKSRRIK